MCRFSMLFTTLWLILTLNNIIGYEAICNCSLGMCCSRWNYCGTSVEYCGVGCQAGKCWSNESGLVKQKPSNISSFHGRCTYYNVQGSYTACGTRHSDHEYIVALNAPQFDLHTPNGNPNRNSLCNRRILVKGPRGSVEVRIVDRCSGCPYGGLDLSPTAFKVIAGNLRIGVVQVTWYMK